jgi:hypothetical protein
MEEDIITVLDMSMELRVGTDTIKRRLQRHGIKPYRYIGPTGIYHRSDMEAIRAAPMGRPKKVAPEQETSVK